MRRWSAFMKRTNTSVQKSVKPSAACTGCDTVTAFKGKGKTRPLQLVVNNPAFQVIGKTVTTSMAPGILFSRRRTSAMPPNKGALHAEPLCTGKLPDSNLETSNSSQDDSTEPR